MLRRRPGASSRVPSSEQRSQLPSGTLSACAADPARGLRAAHHPAGAVHGREQRLLVVVRLDALEDHRLVAHGAADEALLARPGRRAALPDHPVGAAEVLLPPREVVVVVHLVDRLGAEDLEHLGDHDVAAGVGVLARQLHRGDVGVAQLGADLEEHRRRVHLALGAPLVEALALGERQEARGRLVPEAARAEVDADPDPALLVLHEVDVVVARADRAELRLRELHELALRVEVGLEDLLQHGMVGPLLGRHPHAERDPADDLPHDRLDAAEHVEVGLASGPCGRPCCRSRCRSRRRTATRSPRTRSRRRSAASSRRGGRRTGRRTRRRRRSCTARAASGSARRRSRTS